MQGINKVTVLGTVGRKPELKDGGSFQVCNFSVATNEKYKDRTGNYVNNTEWHNIVAFGKQAELIQQYCDKGTHLYIEGKLKTNSWEDSQGNKKSKTSIHLKEFQFLGGDKKSSVKTENKVMDFNNFDGDIPF
jgi:single-strand DNA-binding protein